MDERTFFGRLRRRLTGASETAILGPSPESWAGRAGAAHAALLRAFSIPGSELLRERAPALPADRRYAYLWPFGQALAASIDLALLTRDEAALRQARAFGMAFFAHYWNDDHPEAGGASYPLPEGGDTFYDDNLWIGLALCDLYRATGEPQWLDGAARIFDFVSAAWDDDPQHPHPGGIFWAQPRANPTGDRNTVSNAPAAQLALYLHAATGERRYLDWARRTFDWTERTLRDPKDGLYWDHIKLDGRIERTKWSYNQGTMLGAVVLLGEALAEDTAQARDHARAIAEAALTRYAQGDALWAQDPAFNAIFFHNLFLLGGLIRDHTFYRPALAAYAERVWAGRDVRTGLIGFGRGARVELLTQAAAVRLFATLAASEGERL
jgi:hypothetical protein